MSVALVTGAARGVGRAIALRLARDGHEVAGLDLAPADAVALPVVADVSDPAAVEEAVARAVETLGPPLILVNNAATMSMAPLAEVDPREWRRVLATNLDGPFFCTRAVVPGMVEAGFGRIVSIASEWGVRGAPAASCYAASKGGLIAFTKAAARELGPAGITVNAVAPGAVDTEQLEVDAAFAGVSREEIVGRYAAETPLGRIASSEDVAAAVAYLVSELAACVTGQVLQPNGGTTT